MWHATFTVRIACLHVYTEAPQTHQLVNEQTQGNSKWSRFMLILPSWLSLYYVFISSVKCRFLPSAEQRVRGAEGMRRRHNRSKWTLLSQTDRITGRRAGTGTHRGQQGIGKEIFTGWQGVGISEQEPEQPDPSPEPEGPLSPWTRRAVKRRKQQGGRSRRLRQARTHNPTLQLARWSSLAVLGVGYNGLHDNYS